MSIQPPRMGNGLLCIKASKLLHCFVLLFLLCFLVAEGFVSSAHAASSTATYVDSKLGFSIQAPVTWTAFPQPTSSQTTMNTSVVFTDANQTDMQVELNVMRSKTAVDNFAQGFSTIHIGSYLAFTDDTPSSLQYPIPCLGRVMLAGNDYVTVHWCAPDASVHTQQFEQMLATYLPSSGVQSPKTTMHVNQSNIVNPVESCAQVKATATSTPNPVGTWGTQQGNPTDAQWMTHFSSGAAVCDDFVSSTATSGWPGYEFQCVELVNRFIYEQWGLPSFTVNAAQYYDYYSNGLPQPGAIHTFPAGSYTMSADGSQIPYEMPQTQNFMPSPGDVLIYQDVTDSLRWTSGLVSGTAGHAAIITDVASDHVDVAQQNYSPTKSYTTLPMTKGVNGYQITPPDTSYDTHRIVRGWIHFTANPNNNATAATTLTVSDHTIPSTFVANNVNGALTTFARGSDNNIWYNQQTATAWGGWNALQKGMTFLGDPAVGVNADGRLEVFARGSDNNIWHIWQGTPGGSWGRWTVLHTGYTFQGTPAVAANGNGGLEVFARGSDNRIWYIQQQPGWSSWAQLQSSGQFLGDPTVGKNIDGQLQVFALANDNNIWSVGETVAGGSWNSWAPLQTGQLFQGTPAVGENPDGSLEVLARGSDNNLWYSVQQEGVWSPWSPLQVGSQFSGDPAIGTNIDGRLEVFARGSADGNMYHLWQTTPGGSWTPVWKPLQTGSAFQGRPAVGTNSDGRLELMALGSANNIWHIWQLTAGGSWSGWVQLQTGYGFQQ